MFQVHGKISLPLIFEIRAESAQSAIKYANSILNNTNIIKLEADIYTTQKKNHLLIADDVAIRWSHSECK